jgi:hypothetical protein
LLANVGRDVDDGGHHALGDKAAAVADHADRLAVAGKQGVRRVADVHARGRVGGQHAPLGGGIFDQHVNAHGARRVQPLDHSHGGHVKAQGRHQA